jgi:hypothetical protein
LLAIIELSELLEVLLVLDDVVDTVVGRLEVMLVVMAVP